MGASQSWPGKLRGRRLAAAGDNTTATLAPWRLTDCPTALPSHLPPCPALSPPALPLALPLPAHPPHTPYRREGMTRVEAEDLVATALALAMSRDGSSGGVIRCAAAAAAVTAAASALLLALLLGVPGTPWTQPPPRSQQQRRPLPAPRSSPHAPLAPPTQYPPSRPPVQAGDDWQGGGAAAAHHARAAPRVLGRNPGAHGHGGVRQPAAAARARPVACVHSPSSSPRRHWWR